MSLPLDVVELIMRRGSIFDIEEWRRTSRGLKDRLDADAFWKAVFQQRVQRDRFFESEKGLPPWPEELAGLKNYKWRVICLEVEAFFRTGPVKTHFLRSGKFESRIQMTKRAREMGPVSITSEGNLDTEVDSIVAAAATRINWTNDLGRELVVMLALDGDKLEGSARETFFNAVEHAGNVKMSWVDLYERIRSDPDGVPIGGTGPALDKVYLWRVRLLALIYLMLMRGYQWQEPEELAFRRQKPREVSIATWNIRNFGTRADKHRRFGLIAKYISRHDVVAIQEVMALPVLRRILGMLPARYRYVESKRRASREDYVYFYDSEAVTLIDSGQFDDSRRDAFIREPFVATFKSRYGFDFTLLNVHVYYGKGKSDRRPEVRELAKAAAEALRRNGKEENLILLGDFNMPPDDSSWKPMRDMGFVPLLQRPAKTTVGGISLLDNIWMRRKDVRDYVVRYGFVPFDRGVAREKAMREISDHRPVWVTLSADVDRDADEYGDLSQLKIEARSWSQL